MNDKPTEQKEKIVSKGELFELVHIEQPDGRVFEIARRAPGVRLIIPDREQGKILLNKEYRNELQSWDYRLPGGKLFDSLDEFEDFRKSDKSITATAMTKAKQEANEEAGIAVADLTLFKKSVLGATVEWDLFIFEVLKWTLDTDGLNLEKGELIDSHNWVSFDEARVLIMEGLMQEDRVALILLQWLEQQK